MRTPRQRKKGQSVIEFALVSLLFVVMLVLTFNAILAFCVQQYLSYAVFMAARAYQASSSSIDDQSARANAVLRRFVVPASSGTSVNVGDQLILDPIPKALATITGVSVPTTSAFGPAAVSETKGPYIGLTFTVPFAIGIPMGSLSQNLANITLEARSYLGREVTQQECYGFFNSFLGAFKLPSAAGDPATHFTQAQSALAPFMDDNGC